MFLKMLEKAGLNHPEDPSNRFLKILNMGLISPRKYDLEIW